VTEALSAVQKERDALANELDQAKREKLAASELAEAKLANGLQNAAATKDAEVQGLRAKLDATELMQKLAITEAVNVVAREPDDGCQVRGAEEFWSCRRRMSRILIPEGEYKRFHTQFLLH
jgi:hypothetical protein